MCECKKQMCNLNCIDCVNNVSSHAITFMNESDDFLTP